MSMITVVGSLNMDLVITAPKMPVMGETILGSGFMTTPGGKGANQAVAAARLGGCVTMVGCVGNDIFGKDILKNLELNNVKTNLINIVEGVSTGIAVIVIENGNNAIIVDPGANSLLSSQIVENNENTIKSSNILMVQLEIPLETVEKTVEIAKRAGVNVLLNPAPARRLSDELLRKVDIFTPNETECEIITGLSINSVAEAKEALRFLLNKGIGQVVITMGDKGVVYNRGIELVHKPVNKVKVVDTTAAGDSFSGALAVSLSQGNSIDEAVDFGNIVGALTVTRKGAQASLPTIDEVNNYMKLREMQGGCN